MSTLPLDRYLPPFLQLQALQGTCSFLSITLADVLILVILMFLQSTEKKKKKKNPWH